MQFGRVDLAGIVLVILLSLGFGYLAGQRSHQHEKTSADYCQSKTRAIGYDPAKGSPEDTKDKGNKDFIDVCQQIRSAEAAEDSAAYALIGVALAFFAAAAAILAAKFTFKQAEHASEQVAIMRDEQRPLLMITSLEATGDVAVGCKISLPVKATIKNIGKRPATEAKVAFTTVLYTGDDHNKAVDLERKWKAGQSRRISWNLTIAHDDIEMAETVIDMPRTAKEHEWNYTIYVLVSIEYPLRHGANNGSSGRVFGGVFFDLPTGDGIMLKKPDFTAHDGILGWMD